MKIAKEGWRFILPCAAAALCLAWLGWWPLFLVALGLAGAFAFFFRDPMRRALGRDKDILSPADGKVLSIERLDFHPKLSSPATRVTIFLSLFDVHVTRSPVSGVVNEVEYRPGKFFPAYSDQASQKNESNSLTIRGRTVDVYLKQIVGVAARRIKCFVKQGDRVERGQKIGLMYFGSRVEIWLPGSVVSTVAAGQKVRAGETVIAEVKQ
jgi:phosphatidylserine decarboxylase